MGLQLFTRNADLTKIYLSSFLVKFSHREVEPIASIHLTQSEIPHEFTTFYAKGDHTIQKSVHKKMSQRNTEI